MIGDILKGGWTRVIISSLIQNQRHWWYIWGRINLLRNPWAFPKLTVHRLSYICITLHINFTMIFIWFSYDFQRFSCKSFNFSCDYINVILCSCDSHWFSYDFHLVFRNQNKRNRFWTLISHGISALDGIIEIGNLLLDNSQEDQCIGDQLVALARCSFIVTHDSLFASAL